jgi:hypothetical protein
MDKPFTGADEFFEALERLQFTANDQVVPTGQRECPICKKVMSVEELHGITLDVCRNHGVWLDSGELETILSRVKPKRNR